MGERGNRKCKLRIANEYPIAVLVIRKKTWLSASLTSRNFHPWQPSDTHRLSFDYYFFHTSCLEYRLNEVWCAFFCIFLIFAEKISKYERVLVSSTGELIAFQSWVSFFYVYNYYRKVWIRFWSGPPIRSDACLKLKFLHRQRYPSRGRFSKYLFWNRLCLRFDKAPRTALQRTISTDRKKISSGTHGNDLFASTRKAVFPAPTATGVHLKQRRRRRQRERHNSSRSRLAKQQRCTCITLFCTFPCRHCTTTMWKCLNFTFCRGREHKTTTFFFFSWTLIQSFRIQLQKKLPTFDELNEME